MWGRDDFEWCESLASETHSGGILAVWDPSLFCVTQRFVENRWILLEGCIVKNSFRCCIGIVYGPCDRLGRYEMYESLKDRVQALDKPTLLMGDFN